MRGLLLRSSHSVHVRNGTLEVAEGLPLMAYSSAACTHIYRTFGRCKIIMPVHGHFGGKE